MHIHIIASFPSLRKVECFFVGTRIFSIYNGFQALDLHYSELRILVWELPSNLIMFTHHAIFYRRKERHLFQRHHLLVDMWVWVWLPPDRPHHTPTERPLLQVSLVDLLLPSR